jgi:hypothetical protein
MVKLVRRYTGAVGASPMGEGIADAGFPGRSSAAVE